LIGFADGTVYKMNAMTGALTNLGAKFMDNVKIDALRAVGSSGVTAMR